MTFHPTFRWGRYLLEVAAFEPFGLQWERTQLSFFAGVLADTPENLSPSRITTEEEIEFYVQQFKKTGFR